MSKREAPQYWLSWCDSAEQVLVLDRISLFTTVSKGYGHSSLLRFNIWLLFSSHSLLFGKGTSDLSGYLYKRVRHLPNSLMIALLLSNLASSQALTASHWISTQWVNSASVHARKFWMLNWTTVYCYRNLVLGIHRRYYLDVGVPRFLWLMMFGLTRYFFY